MPRKMKFPESTTARFPEGTFDRITAVLDPTEDRADLIREVVLREVRLREKRLRIVPSSFEELQARQDLDAADQGNSVPDEDIEFVEYNR